MKLPIGRSMKLRVEIPQRCWIEASFKLDQFNNIQTVDWHAQGSFDLINECQKFFNQVANKNIEVVSVEGMKTSQLLLAMLVDKLKGQHIESEDIEICHCRKINRSEIMQAILLGAHTADKVKKWTTASSGCGTCRPDVENLIEVCLKKPA